MSGQEADPAVESRGVPWYIRPKIVLPAVVGLITLSALFAREQIVGRSGDPRLTTYSTQPQGAQLFYELLMRLGWTVLRRESADLPPGAGHIHAVLDPAIGLRGSEVHELLEDVRRGNALLTVLTTQASTIADSLHLRVDQRSFYSRQVLAEPSDACADPVSRGLFSSLTELWPDGRAHLYALQWTAPPPDSVREFVTLAAASDDERQEREAEEAGSSSAPRPRDTPLDARPSVVGFPLGYGRVVVASDPDFLKNDVLRVCRYGLDVRAVRALEYLRDGGEGPRQTILFDEYHQGFGEQPGTTRAIVSYLWTVPSGRLFLQIMVAGLVLLLALAPRALPPRTLSRIERRSPLEHVDALARAYAQVSVTRTTVSHLLHGARRRLEQGTQRLRSAVSDEEFLKRIELAAPELAGHIAVVRHGLEESISTHELKQAVTSLQRIEDTLRNG